MGQKKVGEAREAIAPNQQYLKRNKDLEQVEGSSLSEFKE
jgi:hypothetical protein